MAFKRQRNYSVLMEISMGRNNQARLSTGVTINHKHNLHNNKIRAVQTEENPKQKTQYLNKLMHHVQSEINKLENDGVFITKDMCKHIVGSFGKQTPQAQKQRNQFNIIDHLDTFITLINTGVILTDKGERFKDSKTFITMRNHLYEFERQKGVIKPSTISGRLIREFQMFLSDYKTENGVHKQSINSTINRNVKSLKRFIKRYLQQELKITLDNYNKDEVVNLSSDGKERMKTYLDLGEIARLYALDLSEREPQYAVVRDMWVFIALTCGIRIKNYLALDKKRHLQNVTDEDGNTELCLVFQNLKTGGNVTAPIGVIGLEILEKYNGDLPKASDEISRKLIKKICKWAGINKVLVKENRKGEVVQQKKKYEVVDNHTARRSFCTNSYKAGVDEYTIMRISGHKDRRSFFTYIGTTEEENALRFSKSNYFKLINALDETPIRTIQAV